MARESFAIGFAIGSLRVRAGVSRAIELPITRFGPGRPWVTLAP